MDKKQSKKSHKKSRSRSGKRKEKKSRRKDKHKKAHKKYSRSSRSSSNASRSRSKSASKKKEASKFKKIPLLTSISNSVPQVPQQIANLLKTPGLQNTPTTPSTVQNQTATQATNQQNNNAGQATSIQTNSSMQNAQNEKRTRNVFSSPPKVQTPSVNPLVQLNNSLGLNAQGLPETSITIAPSSLYSSQLGLNASEGVVGNKIPPALQKNYIHALRIYIGNIPDPIDTEDVCHFVYKSLLESGGLLEPGNPIVSKKNDPIKKFIFLQLRSIEETSACMQLDGILYKGKCLRFRRPKDYTTMPQVEGTRKVPILDKNKLRIVQTQVENTYNKLQILNIPESFSEEYVMQMLQQYGELRSFHLAVDIYTGESKGFAFCEYLTDKATIDCLNLLSGQQILNKIINVKRCNPNLAPPVEEQMQPIENLIKNLCDFVNKSILESGYKDIQEEYIQKLIASEGQKYCGLYSDEATNVLKIKNVIDKQVIEEDPEYEFIFNDLKSQLEKFGRVKQMIIPRLKEKYSSDSVGLVFVEFENEKVCQVANFLLQGKKYDGREIKTEFYNVQYFADKQLF